MQVAASEAGSSCCHAADAGLTACDILQRECLACLRVKVEHNRILVTEKPLADLMLAHWGAKK